MTTDFKQEILPSLYKSLKEQEYEFITFGNFLTKGSKNKFVILRHDVERYYSNALKFAEIQHDLGIRGTYFFRMSKHYNEQVIRKITNLGHEAGYHYDDLSKCHGDYEKAINRFKSNLLKLRSITEIRTISMDGSPLSKYDNRMLWGKYDYSDYGIIGEPYFDVDYKEVFYLTDTGRRWNGSHLSLRDKVKEGIVFEQLKHTKDIIDLASKGALPDKILMTFHPQRWTNNTPAWIREIIWQNVKNQVKWVMVKTRK